MSVPDWPRGLLVSVRDVEEAIEAVAGGAAVIDVKEPARGPLGRADAAVAAAIGRALGGRLPWTGACGELADGADIAAHVHEVLASLGPDAAPPLAVKAGPAALDLAAWNPAQRRLAASLPAGIAAVAVAYADWERARAPDPRQIIAAAGGGMLLVDTCDKCAGGLFDDRSEDEVAAWLLEARQSGLRVTLAGRLRAGQVSLAALLGADLVAVRSAACRGGRMGRVDSELVREIARLSGGGTPRREPLRTGGSEP